MVQTKPLAFLEELKSKIPSLSAQIDSLAGLYNRRLWHQLTSEVQKLMNASEMQQVGRKCKDAKIPKVHRVSPRVLALWSPHCMHRKTWYCMNWTVFEFHATRSSKCTFA